MKPQPQTAPNTKNGLYETSSATQAAGTSQATPTKFVTLEDIKAFDLEVERAKFTPVNVDKDNIPFIEAEMSILSHLVGHDLNKLGGREDIVYRNVRVYKKGTSPLSKEA